MFHYNNKPVRSWWKQLSQTVPLNMKHRDLPTHVHGQVLKHIYHQGDMAKLEVLMEYGGIYLDYDVIVVNSMNDLLHYNMTLGKVKKPKFIAGIIIGNKDALFLKMWYEAYRKYKANSWEYNCATVPYNIYIENPNLVHVEFYKLTTPDFFKRDLLLMKTINWRDLYVVHLMSHELKVQITPDSIKQWNSTLAAVMRYIYYGSDNFQP